MKSMITIGTDKGAIVEARKTILEILKTKRCDEVVLQALKALHEVCNVNGTTITGCRFVNKD